MIEEFDITNGFWVFGYGSLIWQPDFPYTKQKIARLSGYRRSFCMWSIHHRGTPEHPGLVLALDPAPNGYCDGIAFRVTAQDAEGTLAALRARELISSAYVETLVEVTAPDGTRHPALAYVIDTNHVQYCSLTLEEQAQVIARSIGGRGPNTEYLWNTAQHLHKIGLGDADLNWLSARVKEITNAQ